MDDDDDGETKYWTNGNDAEKSKSKQQSVGGSVLSHILREVIFRNIMVRGWCSEWEVAV